MLLSIPSGFDVDYPTEQHENVQIEISIMEQQTNYSILVTSQESQVVERSVITMAGVVPNNDCMPKRSRRFIRKSTNRSAGLPPKSPQSKRLQGHYRSSCLLDDQHDYSRPSSPAASRSSLRSSFLEEDVRPQQHPILQDDAPWSSTTLASSSNSNSVARTFLPSMRSNPLLKRVTPPPVF